QPLSPHKPGARPRRRSTARVAASTRRLRSRDVIEVIDNIAKRAEVQANRTLARLRALFNWAVGKDRLSSSPIMAMKPPTKERARDRALTDDELRWFWLACEAIDWPFGPLAKLLLLTAQRRDEVAKMESSEIDFTTKYWTLPRHKVKNDRAHEVHLSNASIECCVLFLALDTARCSQQTAARCLASRRVRSALMPRCSRPNVTSWERRRHRFPIGSCTIFVARPPPAWRD